MQARTHLGPGSSARASAACFCRAFLLLCVSDEMLSPVCFVARTRKAAFLLAGDRAVMADVRGPRRGEKGGVSTGDVEHRRRGARAGTRGEDMRAVRDHRSWWRLQPSPRRGCVGGGEAQRRGRQCPTARRVSATVLVWCVCVDAVDADLAPLLTVAGGKKDRGDEEMSLWSLRFC